MAQGTSTREHVGPEHVSVDHEQSFRLLVESIGDYAVFMLDVDGRVRSWNVGAERLKGWRADEIVGESFAAFYPEEDVRAGKPQEILRAAAAEGRVEDQGWRVRKDGSRFFARVIVTALRDAQGRLVGFGKVTSDVTEAMTRAERELRAERALRESQEAFRLLVENVRDYALYMLDPEGRVTTWNAGAERLKGYTAAEVVGRHFSTFYTPEDLRSGKPARELELAARDGRVEDQGWRIRKDGSRFYARVVITALRDPAGTLRGFAKVTNDVTENHIAVERVLRVVTDMARLMESTDYRDRLRTVAQLAVPSLADWCVVDSVAEGAPRRLVAHHGDPGRAELMREVERVAPIAEAPRGIAAVLRSGEPLVVSDARDLSGVSVPDESYRALLRRLELGSFACMPLVARGRTLGAITFCSTLPGRYRADDLGWLEAFARTAASAMDNALLLEESQRALQEAQAAVAVRESFLSVASHELRTPLNTLQLQVQSFVRHAERTADERGLERLRRVQVQGDRLAALIRTLLDVSRIAAGRLHVEPSDLDLCELVREVAGRDAELAHGAGCELRLELPGPVVGRWDRLRLDQVLTNLLGNAIKFGAGKPVVIAVEATPDRARLLVRDEGIGIAPEDQARVFQRFERAVSSRSFGGFGLGLWIVREFVEAHGGTVRLESEPGKGALFTVDLPRAGPPPQLQ